MTEFDFEEFFVRLLAKLHYGEIERLVPAQGTGRDILVNTTNGLVLVECRHHPNVVLGRPTVRNLHSAITSHRAVKGMLVTTGHFTEDAVAYAHRAKPAIELVDWSKLAEMARRAGITLVSKTQKLAVWTFPLPSVDTTRSSLGEQADSILGGYPRSASSMLRIEQRMLQYRPIYMVTYDIDAVFATTIGVVHRERASRATLALDGTSGEVLDKTISEFFANESQIQFLGPTGESQGELPTLGLDATSVQNNVKDIVSGIHTKSVRYRARRNNRMYVKLCKPNERDIVVRDIRQVYLPSFKVHFKILETDYHSSLFQTSSGRLMFQQNDATLCRICDSRIESHGIVCDTCGRCAHSGGFIGSVHGFRCARCRRTTCRVDGHWTRRLLMLKEPLCPVCASEAEKKGSKVEKLKPIRTRPIS